MQPRQCTGRIKSPVPSAAATPKLRYDQGRLQHVLLCSEKSTGDAVHCTSLCSTPLPSRHQPCGAESSAPEDKRFRAEGGRSPSRAKAGRLSSALKSPAKAYSRSANSRKTDGASRSCLPKQGSVRGAAGQGAGGLQPLTPPPALGNLRAPSRQTRARPGWRR